MNWEINSVVPMCIIEHMSDSTTVPHAAAVVEALEQHLRLDLDGAAAADLRAELHALEIASRKLRAAQARVLAACRERQTARELGYINERQLLTGELGISAAQARCQLDDATKTQTARMQAVAAGNLSTGKERVIDCALRQLPIECDDAVGHELERRLLDYAPHTTCRRLHTRAQELLDELVPGHTEGGDADRRRRRSVQVSAQGLDLMAHASAVMDPELTALMREVHARWAQPGRLWHDDTAADTRTDAQRMHDALTHALRLALSTDAERVGAPAAIVIRMNLDQLATLAGCAETDGGIRVPVEQALSMARGRHWFLALCDKQIELRLFRSRRTASWYQRLALFAAYGGCTHPDCDQDARHCQAHHAAKPWARGGNTNIGELALATGDCHAMIHDRGWRTIPDRSAPQGVRWIPPTHTGRRPPDPPHKPGAPPMTHLTATAVPFALLRDLESALHARDRGRSPTPADERSNPGSGVLGRASSRTCTIDPSRTSRPTPTGPAVAEAR